jgi:hypothetical protein
MQIYLRTQPSNINKMNSVVTRLAVLLAEAKTRIKVGSIYKHYRGKTFEIKDIALEESTVQPIVVYKDTFTELTWVRQLDDFCSNVQLNDKMVPRFTLKD